MESKKVVRSTNAQLKYLVDYMSVNTLFANGEFTGPLGARRITKEWEKLRGFLRQYRPDKTVDQWKHANNLRCSVNEEVKCVKVCPPESTCKTRGILFSCLNDEKPCEQKCLCKDGYYRNSAGHCVTNEQCDKCQGDHEYFECGPVCDHECSKLDVQNKTNCPFINIVCNPKCYCDDGYARDSKRNCVPVQDCPPALICTGLNEVHTDCKRACPPDTCISLVAKFKCDSQQPCEAGCACKPGYLRPDDQSPCVPLCECPQMRNKPECITGSKYGV